MPRLASFAMCPRYSSIFSRSATSFAPDARRARHLGSERPVVADAREEELRHLLLVLQVRLLLALRDLEERRLRDVEEALVDHGLHVPVEERQEQRADVRAVDVGVGHHDDLVVPDLGRVEVLGDPGAERRDERPDLGGREHLVEPRLLDVQDLAAQREDRLELAVAALLRAAAGAVALDDEELGEARGPSPGSPRACPGSEPESSAPLRRTSSRALRAASRARADSTIFSTILFATRGFSSRYEPELLVDDLLDPRLDLGRDELVLRLRGELRVAHLDGDDGRQPLAAVVAGEARLLQGLRQAVWSPRTSGAPASARS